MTLRFREMSIEDYDEVMPLWRGSEGVGLSDTDSRESIRLFLARNPNLNFLAYEDELLVGAVLCGHDGRRGYIYHLAVKMSHRRQGIARQLVKHCLGALQSAGIGKCHIYAFRDNGDAMVFWKKAGWFSRHDLAMFSHYTEGVAQDA